MIRRIGLHQHLARPLASPGPTSQLHQQLESLLFSAEIRSMQQAVSRQHRRQGDLWQIHAFGQHLRTDQNVGLASRKTLQQAPVPITPPCGITVESQQAQISKLVGQEFQHPLRSSSEWLEGSGPAVAASRPDLGAMVTPMAAQPLSSSCSTVHGQGHVTVRALNDLATASTAQKRAVSPSGHKDHSLFPLLGQGRQTVHQRSADHTAMAV